MSADISDPRKEEYLRRASSAARARDMMGFLNACQRAGTSAYGLLAELTARSTSMDELHADWDI